MKVFGQWEKRRDGMRTSGGFALDVLLRVDMGCVSDLRRIISVEICRGNNGVTSGGETLVSTATCEDSLMIVPVVFLHVFFLHIPIMGLKCLYNSNVMPVI